MNLRKLWDNLRSLVRRREPKPESQRETQKTCYVCGKPFVFDREAAISEHVRADGQIDYEQDANHIPYSKDEVPF